MLSPLCTGLSYLGRRLEELGEQRGSLVTRAQVSTRELEALEGTKAAAEAYLDKERDLLDSRASILQLFLRDGQVSLPCRWHQGVLVLHV